MTISEIIEELKKIQKEHGDIQTGCDFRSHDAELCYDEELNCIFGD